VFDSQAEKHLRRYTGSTCWNLSEFYSAAGDFAVVASKGNPSESQSKILELSGFTPDCLAYHI
jgi:hypothetical protein